MGWKKRSPWVLAHPHSSHERTWQVCVPPTVLAPCVHACANSCAPLAHITYPSIVNTTAVNNCCFYEAPGSVHHHPGRQEVLLFPFENISKQKLKEIAPSRWPRGSGQSLDVGPDCKDSNDGFSQLLPSEVPAPSPWSVGRLVSRPRVCGNLFL